MLFLRGGGLYSIRKLTHSSNGVLFHSPRLNKPSLEQRTECIFLSQESCFKFLQHKGGVLFLAPPEVKPLLEQTVLNIQKGREAFELWFPLSLKASFRNQILFRSPETWQSYGKHNNFKKEKKRGIKPLRRVSWLRTKQILLRARKLL